MEKMNKILTFITIVLSIALAYFIVNFFVLKNIDVNQGNFRMNDIVISSTLDVKDNTDNKEGEINSVKLSFTQNNKILVYITKTAELKEMYIENFKFTKPKEIGEIYFSQSLVEGKKKISDLKKVILESITKDNEYYLELNINNEYFREDLVLSEETKEVKFDGTILNNYDILSDDIKFTVSFDLVLVDSNGNKNVCEMKFDLPADDITKTGSIIKRLNLSNYNFKINE